MTPCQSHCFHAVNEATKDAEFKAVYLQSAQNAALRSPLRRPGPVSAAAAGPQQGSSEAVSTQGLARLPEGAADGDRAAASALMSMVSQPGMPNPSVVRALVPNSEPLTKQILF